MNAIMEAVATNAILAAVLAVMVLTVTRFVKRPTVQYWLWMLVLLKLVTPPIIAVPMALKSATTTQSRVETKTVAPEFTDVFSVETLNAPIEEALLESPQELRIDAPPKQTLLAEDATSAAE